MERSRFRQEYKKFQLGVLPTEKPHVLSQGLSQLAKNDLKTAIHTLKNIDLKAMEALSQYASEIEVLKKDIQKVLLSGGRIFLCGCGATGRLSLLLEFLWREKFNNDQVRAFMAGGDVALVHSLEGFEDFPERGARHLNEMGFTANDLLISVTEGGETPYVIGATEEAERVSNYSPWFLHCNPRDILVDHIERSQRVIENPQIKDLSLFVGPMGLSGSTRMQASTVLQLAVGAALLEPDTPAKKLFENFHKQIWDWDEAQLAPFILKEQDIYENGEFVMYMPREFAISVFTDTTERSPTFSLPSFENDTYSGESPSLCYILIPQANSAEEAWSFLLKRKPHALNWQSIDTQTTQGYLNHFDFSKFSQEKREERLKGRRQYLFEIDRKDKQILLSVGGVEAAFPLLGESSLLNHSFLKIILNIHSTLLMGRMGRYESNIMTWVRPTNAKLVDRACRYILYLLKEKSIQWDYLAVVDEIYNEMQETQDTSIVLRVYEKILQQSQRLREGHV